MGVTLANFQEEGKSADEIEKFRSLQTGVATTGAIALRTRALIPSGRVAVFVGILLIVSIVCFSVNNGISKLVSESMRELIKFLSFDFFIVNVQLRGDIYKIRVH